MEIANDTPLSLAIGAEKAGKIDEAIRLYEAMVADTSNPPETEEDQKIVEVFLGRLGSLYASKKDVDALVSLAARARPHFKGIAKIKTAKIVRTLIDQVSRAQGSKPTEALAKLCVDTIEWAEAEKRTFLKSRVQTRLASVWVDMTKYELALNLLAELIREMKQMDDKLLLVEIHLTETRANFACGHLPKAKAALTAAKTNANQIHCPPLQQAEIDLWSGIVSLREKDPRTAFSYLVEAFEAFNANRDEASHTATDYTYARAMQSLKCQLLCRILQDQPGQCKGLMMTKNALKFADEASIKAILKIAVAYEDRSLKKLEGVLAEHPVNDPIIQFHLEDLYDTFLEKNLLKILEPFSQVELSHVAELIELDEKKTQTRLSQMILDEKLRGTLDEGKGNLILYPESQPRKTCDHLLETIKHAGDCVDSLQLLAKKISAV